ncbi:hypothetical protein [Thauera sp. 63]|uniref:hypothetical protein n=1 Tax=Thauera sp. 63 TaxID=497321 RepID=UPI0012F99818|nr:hypothetical protein [Thauera sp. 63]
MPTDPCLATLVRSDWLDAGPLGHLIDPYIGALRGQRYGGKRSTNPIFPGLATL